MPLDTRVGICQNIQHAATRTACRSLSFQQRVVGATVTTGMALVTRPAGRA
jgi:hypothetical protein